MSDATVLVTASHRLIMLLDLLLLCHRPHDLWIPLVTHATTVRRPQTEAADAEKRPDKKYQKNIPGDKIDSA